MEKPILFKTTMVQAILDGTKTQTRRIIKLPSKSESWKLMFENHPETMYQLAIEQCPYGKVGDILWVRETWAYKEFNHNKIYYRADGELGDVNREGGKWHPSIHMPKEAARLFLKVTNIRVERLQDITEDDAKNEGITSYWAEPHRDVAPFIGAAKELGADLCPTRREAFQQLWSSCIQKYDYGSFWQSNPWVWVIEFEKVSQ